MNNSKHSWLGFFILLSLTACGSQAENGASASAETAGPVDGASAFTICANCHTNTAGAPHRAGPNLYGVVGRKAGEAPGFAYSPALRASGIVWNEQTLDAYLSAPTQLVPGTKMSMATPEATKREALIRYLSANAP